jgi:hypothetical protein
MAEDEYKYKAPHTHTDYCAAMAAAAAAVLRVEGMVCGACVRTVSTALESVAGVSSGAYAMVWVFFKLFTQILPYPFPLND